MKEFNLQGTKRTEVGKKATRELRKEGKVPCVIYGNQKEDGGWSKKAHDGWDWVKEHLTPDKNRHVWCIL